MKPSRRQLIQWLTASGLSLPFTPLWAMGKDDRFSAARLKYEGNWDPRPDALRRMLLEVEKRTSVVVDPNPTVVDGMGASLFEQPFLVWSGDRKFAPLPEKVIENLRLFLQYGGFLLVDSAEGIQDGPFIDSVKRDLKRVTESKLARISKDHVLYKSFYLIEKPTGRLDLADSMEGIWDDDRVSVVISTNDLQGAWARDMFGNFTYECRPGGERQREMAYRLGLNVIMYALCINYKADQVHVPFILRRRKWKVD